MFKDITAIVPVRGGSQRVKNKNTRDFGNTNLLDLKLTVLESLLPKSQILVSTDCLICESIAKGRGMQTVERDSFSAGSTIDNAQHWSNIAQQCPSKILFMAQVTSPMVKRSSYLECLNRLLESETSTCITSVSEEKKFLWKNESPINYNYSLTPKSQDLPDIFSLNFAITIANKDEVIKSRNIVTESPLFHTLSKTESIDIDDIDDFEYAEYKFLKYGLKWIMK